MKNLFKIGSIFGVLLAVGIAVSCEKEEIVKTEDATIETNENRMPVRIRPIRLAPDLVVTFVNSDLPVVNPSACGGPSQQVTCGVANTLTVKVKNIGNAAVTNYYYIEMDKPTGNTTTQTFMSPSSTLAPGATHVFNIGPAPFGGCVGVPFTMQDLVITADIYDDVSESDESNNVARAYHYCGD